jgi:hypothetical protein
MMTTITMEPIHSLEYELTSQLANEIQHTLVRWEMRRSWRQEIRVFAGAAFFAVLLTWLSLSGLMLPAVGGGLMCLVLLFVLGAVYRRWAGARGSASMAVLALYTSDRRVRVEFTEDHIRQEMEYFRGEGTWSELETIIIFPDFWLLALSNGGRIVLPAASVSPELDLFLRAKAQQVLAPVIRQA